MAVFDPQILLQWGTIYGGVVLGAAWFAMVVWVYRDMRARSRDFWVQLLAGALVLLLNIPGLIIYIFLRPRETLSEAYERSLEEEALLQEIEDKPNCPGCGQRVEHEWQACPYCHTRLKKPCINCARMLQLSWELCPHCATPQTMGASDGRSHVSRSVRVNHSPATEGSSPEPWAIPQDYDTNTGSELEFIDEDY